MSNKEPNEDDVMRKLGFELDTNIVDVYDHYINRYTSEWFSIKTARAITTLLAQSQINILNKAHRVNGKNDYDNETDEYIDELLEALEGDK